MKTSPSPLPDTLPLISVIIPTHNRSHLLRTAVLSALQQTYSRIEVIVVDDRSQDDTAAVVAAIHDPRLLYIRNEGTRGAAGSRNAGIAASRGDLIAFLDDDDQWFCGKLETQQRTLAAATPDTGLCLCGYICYSGPHQVEYIGGDHWFSLLDFSRGIDADYRLIITSGWLIRRQHLLQIGCFDEAMPVWEDWEAALRLQQACRFTHVPEPLFLFNRDRPAGQTENKPARAVALRRLIDKHSGLWAHSTAIQANHLVIIALSERGKSSRLTTLRQLLKALGTHWTHRTAWNWTLRIALLEPLQRLLRLA